MQYFFFRCLPDQVTHSDDCSVALFFPLLVYVCVCVCAYRRHPVLTTAAAFALHVHPLAYLPRNCWFSAGPGNLTLLPPTASDSTNCTGFCQSIHLDCLISLTRTSEHLENHSFYCLWPMLTYS